MNATVIKDADHARMRRRLDEKPEDWTTRIVLADWYEEHGRDDLAEAQRWMAANRKRAQGGVGCTWYCGSRMDDGSDPMSDLPDDVFDALTEVEESMRYGCPPIWHDYASQEEADEALAEALKKLKGKEHGTVGG